MGTFIYPRTISIRRPKTQSVASSGNAATLKPYIGHMPGTVSPMGEDVIFSGLPASIQFTSPLSRAAGSRVPTDTHSTGAWNIFIPKKKAALGQIKNRDVVIDDLGNRYQVEAAYYNSLGYKLRVRMLEL